MYLVKFVVDDTEEWFRLLIIFSVSVICVGLSMSNWLVVVIFMLSIPLTTTTLTFDTPRIGRRDLGSWTRTLV